MLSAVTIALGFLARTLHFKAHLTLYQVSIVFFNLEALLLVLPFLILPFKHRIPVFLSLFLFIRYVLYFSYYYENNGIRMEMLGSTGVLAAAVLVHEYGLDGFLRKHIMFNQSMKTLVLVSTVFLVAMDSAVYANITACASIAYLILVLPAIYYYILDREKPLTMLVVYMVFSLLFSSDAREFIILFWLDWDIHWFALLTKEQFLVWITAIIILYSYEDIRVRRGWFIAGTIALAVANILQAPWATGWVAVHNPFNIMCLLIRVTPLPLLASLGPLGEPSRPYRTS